MLGVIRSVIQGGTDAGRGGRGRVRTEQQVQSVQSLWEPQVVQALWGRQHVATTPRHKSRALPRIHCEVVEKSKTCSK